MLTRKTFGWIAGIEVAIFTVLQGSAVTLGLLVAPIVFITIRNSHAVANPDDLAGKVFGDILHIWFWATLVCALILLSTSVYTYLKVKPRSRLLLGRMLAMGVITILTLIFAYALFRIDAIQNGLPQPIDTYPTGVNPRAEFDFLHSLSTDLISASLVVGTVWLVLSVLAVVKLSQLQTNLHQPTEAAQIAARV